VIETMTWDDLEKIVNNDSDRVFSEKVVKLAAKVEIPREHVAEFSIFDYLDDPKWKNMCIETYQELQRGQTSYRYRRDNNEKKQPLASRE